MSYTYGLVNQRTYPEMEVVRNFNPTFPEGYTYAARSAVSIKSGQAIVLDVNGMWVLADSDTAAHLLKEIFFALHDSDVGTAYGRPDAIGAALGKDASIDKSTMDAYIAAGGGGEVVGYSCMGQYILRTGYYTTTGSPTTGDFLTIGSVAGNLVKTTLESGYPIVGRVTEPVMTINEKSAGSVLNTINSNVPLDTKVITFKTWYSPNLVDHSA